MNSPIYDMNKPEERARFVASYPTAIRHRAVSYIAWRYGKKAAEDAANAKA